MVAVYPVPDPRTGDQVMAAIELNATATFDAAAFESFLAEQRDLGTKWSPRFVRIITQMPLTANNKVNKQPLRVPAWDSSDEVWWQPTRGASYRLFTAADRRALQTEFARHDRQQFLPSSLRA